MKQYDNEDMTIRNSSRPTLDGETKKENSKEANFHQDKLKKNFDDLQTQWDILRKEGKR
jgi:hypothetical protein